MEVSIKTLTEKKLIGKRLAMTYAENKTFALWASFMSRRKEIKGAKNSDLFSIQMYPKDFDFKNFSFHTSFHKWAAVEVIDFTDIPKEMESLIIENGLYAVFHFKGDMRLAEQTFRYIFETWLPASEFELDERPHFEILGEKYKNNDPNSEEDIWIPIKKK